MNDNSNGEDLLYSEIRNPIFQALENQLRIEFEWAYVDKNLYSFSWIALHLKELTEEDLRRVNNLVKEALNRVAKGNIVPFINTEFILGLCFAARIIYEKRGEIPSNLLDNLNKLLREARKRSWLRNHEFVSLIVRFLPNITEFSDVIKEGVTWLQNKCQESLRKRDYERAVDCLFGLCEKGSSQLTLDFLREALSHINELSDEAVAKLCILLHDQNRELAIRFVKELERRIENEFKGSPGLSLERGLRELVCLLNSDCPVEAIRSILTVKKEQGQDWAKNVRVDGKSIIIQHVPRVGELPRVDPKVHALALKALESYRRSSIIALNKDDFIRLKEVFNTARKGYLGIRKREYLTILLIAGVTSFFALMFLPNILSAIWNFDYKTIAILLGDLKKNWLLVLTQGSQRAVLLCIWLWIVRVLYRLRRGGEINLMEAVRLLPIIGYIVKRLLGRG